MITFFDDTCHTSSSFYKEKKPRKSKQIDKLTLGSYFKLNDIYSSMFIESTFSRFFSLSLISQLLLLQRPPAIRGALSHIHLA
jgi:hypothetical protein